MEAKVARGTIFVENFIEDEIIFRVGGFDVTWMPKGRHRTRRPICKWTRGGCVGRSFSKSEICDEVDGGRCRKPFAGKTRESPLVVPCVVSARMDPVESFGPELNFTRIGKEGR